MRPAHEHASGLRRLSTTVGLATAAVLLLAAPGAGAGRQPVDPGTLNPPVPAEFHATCSQVGNHISCSLAFSDPDVLGEPSGIVCDGTELVFTQTRSVVGTRSYDASGDLLQRHFRESLGGTLTNPDTGKVALWAQHDTVINNLSIPGDLGSGTEQISGLVQRVWLEGGGTILTDSGTTLVDVSTGEALRSSAHHPFDAYFGQGDTTALAPLCAALG